MPYTLTDDEIEELWDRYGAEVAEVAALVPDWAPDGHPCDRAS